MAMRLLPILILCCTAALSLKTSPLHRAVERHRREHRRECDEAAKRYAPPPGVDRSGAAAADALARGAYREEDVWAAERVFPDTARIVGEVDRAREGWSTERHATWQASGAVADCPLPHLPGATAWLAERFASTVAPIVAEVLPGLVEDPADLRIVDAFIVRYVAGAGDAGDDAGLPAHVDGGLVSVNIGLNDGFEGGGTRFERSGRVVGGGAGSLTVHPSAKRHAGEPISDGARLILVAFCASSKDAELCRRFVREGRTHRERGDGDAATLAFRRAAKFDAADVPARHGLGTQRYYAGDFCAAARDFYRCLVREGGEAECRNALVLASLGETLVALGAYAEALAVARRLSALAPRDFGARLTRVKAAGALLHDAGLEGDAASAFGDAVADATAAARDAADAAALEAVLAECDALFVTASRRLIA